MAKLTRQQVEKIINERPEGTTPEGIVAALRSEGHELEGYPSPGRVRASMVRTRVSPAVNVIPDVLGSVGGILGGAGSTILARNPAAYAGGSMLGAAVGGGAGEVARQAIVAALGGQALESGDTPASAIAREAQMQGILEGLGLGVAGGANKFGQAIIRRSVKAAPSITRALGTAEEADVPRLIAQKRIFTSKKADEAVKRGSAASRAATERAGRGGQYFTFDELARDAIKQNERELGRRLTVKEKMATENAVYETVREVLGSRLVGVESNPYFAVTPDDLYSIKQETGQRMRAFFKASQAGQQAARPSESVRQTYAASRRLLEGVPGFEEAQRATREAGAIREALIGMESRNPPQLAPMWGGAIGSALPPGLATGDRLTNALIGYMLGSALSNPKVQIRAGQALTAPAVRNVLRQAPRAGMTLFDAGGNPLPEEESK